MAFEHEILRLSIWVHFQVRNFISPVSTLINTLQGTFKNHEFWKFCQISRNIWKFDYSERNTCFWRNLSSDQNLLKQLKEQIFIVRISLWTCQRTFAKCLIIWLFEDFFKISLVAEIFKHQWKVDCPSILYIKQAFFLLAKKPLLSRAFSQDTFLNLNKKSIKI